MTDARMHSHAASRVKAGYTERGPETDSFLSSSGQYGEAGWAGGALGKNPVANAAKAEVGDLAMPGEAGGEAPGTNVRTRVVIVRGQSGTASPGVAVLLSARATSTAKTTKACG